MDELRIDNLRFFAHHGVYEFERTQGQPFVLSAVLETDTRKAGWSDQLEDSTSYAQAAEVLVHELTSHTFSLLEAAAEHACRTLLLQFPRIHSVELELCKPEAPMDLDFDSVSVRIRRGWHTAYLGLGSNLGDREATLRSALSELARPEVRVEQVSSLLVTPPYGGVEQEDFLNGVCRVSTLLSPEELLEVLQKIEQGHHRTREVHWGPRTLDLDILFYDNIIMYTEALKIPHPDLHNRRFVLEPLAEINPYVMHPVLGRSAAQMLSELPR